MIKRVWINHFRNLQELRVDCASFRHIYVYGNNNQGKTNFLESLYYIGHGKTPSSSDLNVLLNFNQPVGYLGADIEQGDAASRIYMKLDRENGRHITLNNDIVKRTITLKQCCPIEYLSSDINREFTSTPDARRRSFNHVLEILDPDYARSLKKYKEIIRQKNAMLKTRFDPRLYDIFNQSLATEIPTIVQKRMNYCQKSSTRLESLLRRILEDPSLTMSIQYQCRYTSDFKHLQDDFLSCVNTNKYKEVNAKGSLYGPHRDDIQFQLNGRDCLVFASKGIGRLVSILMKLIDLIHISEAYHSFPVLLLDDTFSEIDDGLKSKLITLLTEYTQLIYCTTRKEDSHYFTEAGIFKMEEGAIRYEASI